MTTCHSTLFTLRSGQSGLGFYTTQRDAARKDVATITIFGSDYVGNALWGDESNPATKPGKDISILSKALHLGHDACCSISDPTHAC